MRRSATCALLLLLGLAAEARGKPISFVVDQELQQAWGVFEASATVKGAAVTLQVTRDPRRVYRGLDQLGRTLEARFWGGGGSSGAQWLLAHRGQPVLLVLDHKREIRLAALRCKTGYRFHGFYDFNGVWLRCNQAGFGRVVSKERWGIGAPMEVTALTLARTFAAERHVLQRKAAILLMTPAEQRTAAYVERLIARLGSRSFAVREKAQAALAERAVFQLDLVRSNAGNHPELEVRRRLERVLEPIALWVEARKLAERATGDRALRERILASHRMQQGRPAR